MSRALHTTLQQFEGELDENKPPKSMQKLLMFIFVTQQRTLTHSNAHTHTSNTQRNAIDKRKSERNGKK